MTALLAVVVGGGIGSGLRHGVNLAAARWLGTSFPWGTLTVNVVGSFLIGALAAWFAFRASAAADQTFRLFLVSGVLGGFTTFSAFSLDFALLAERGELGAAIGYVAASVLVSLAAIFAGLWLVRALT